MKNADTLSDFIRKANNVHRNYYSYCNSVYINSRSKITITCPIHGDFTQIASNHLNGKKCLKCTRSNHTPSHKLNIDKFIDKSNLVHNFKYDYTNSVYKNTRSKLEITCHIHGPFFQIANNHLQGSECDQCSYGSVFSKTKWINMCYKKDHDPLVYIIRCFNDNENFIKIGKTSFSVKSRFVNGALPYSYEIIKEIKGSADFVFDEEVRLHRLYVDKKYKPLIDFGGKTECFSIETLRIIQKVF